MNRSKNRIHLVRLITCIIWVLQFGSPHFTEAQNTALINEETLQKIESPYQLTFIHEIPKNKVDSLLIDLLAFEYHQENGIVKHKILEDIAKTKAKEAFYLLYVGCISPPTTDNYFPPFQQLCYVIKNNGGLALLNKYFVKEPVKETGLEKDFEREVILQCKKMNPEPYYYKNLPQEINLDIIRYEIEQFKKDNIICKSPQLLTKNNLHKIQNVYELTFLHEKPVNRVDSCVKYLMDSIRWDRKRNWYLVIDSVVNSIGASQSQEALQLFYLFTKYNVTSQNNQLQSLQQSFHGRQVEYLHDYFYQDKKLNRDSLGYMAYRNKILTYFKNKVPDIYFCDQPTELELYTRQANSSNLRKLDKQIIKIIKRNNSLFRKAYGKAIENEIWQLPFVKDVHFGDCYAVNDLLTTFFFTRVYTKIVDGDRIIERIYVIKNRRLIYFRIKLGKFRWGKFISCRSKKWKFSKAYSYPALDKVKKYCEEDNKTHYINLKSEK